MDSTLVKIAVQIANRGDAQGWKPNTKTADKLNIEAWAGAIAALQVVDHPDLANVLNYACFAISTRGYSETLKLAAKAQGTAEEGV